MAERKTTAAEAYQARRRDVEKLLDMLREEVAHHAELAAREPREARAACRVPTAQTRFGRSDREGCISRDSFGAPIGGIVASGLLIIQRLSAEPSGLSRQCLPNCSYRSRL